MKKLLKNLITFLLIGNILLFPIQNIKAKTLGEVKKEVKKLEKTRRKSKNTKLTKEEQEKTKQNIEQIKTNIKKSNQDITNLTTDINKTNKEIKTKQKEIETIASYIQLSNGESSYLEYAFGSKSFEDFIYRLAVAEQLSKYNDNLVKEYNKNLKETKDKKIELKNKQIELDKQQKNLEIEVTKLGKKIETLNEGKLDLATELKSQQEVISLYKSLGCKDNDNINSDCGIKKLEEASKDNNTNNHNNNSNTSNNNNNTNTNNTPQNTTSFIKPLTSGTITSNYGWRFHPTLGYSRLHSGLDIAKSGQAVPIYPTAAGMVVNIVKRSSCGGNIIYIHHRINGKNYTSVYMHLRNIYVSKGQTVTKNTQIATMGGSSSQEYWDTCSTGQHLHFTIANGLYFKEYTSYDTFLNKTFDPRNVINFPSLGGTFYNR